MSGSQGLGQTTNIQILTKSKKGSMVLPLLGEWRAGAGELESFNMQVRSPGPDHTHLCFTKKQIFIAVTIVTRGKYSPSMPPLPNLPNLPSSNVFIFRS